MENCNIYDLLHHNEMEIVHVGMREDRNIFIDIKKLRTYSGKFETLDPLRSWF